MRRQTQESHDTRSQPELLAAMGLPPETIARLTERSRWPRQVWLLVVAVPIATLFFIIGWLSLTGRQLPPIEVAIDPKTTPVMIEGEYTRYAFQQETLPVTLFGLLRTSQPVTVVVNLYNPPAPTVTPMLPTPTFTPEPPTATPESPTPTYTPEPPTSTPEPPTPTPIVEVLSIAPNVSVITPGEPFTFTVTVTKTEEIAQNLRLICNTSAWGRIDAIDPPVATPSQSAPGSTSNQLIAPLDSQASRATTSYRIVTIMTDVTAPKVSLNCWLEHGDAASTRRTYLVDPAPEVSRRLLPADLQLQVEPSPLLLGVGETIEFTYTLTAPDSQPYGGIQLAGEIASKPNLVTATLASDAIPFVTTGVAYTGGLTAAQFGYGGLTFVIKEIGQTQVVTIGVGYPGKSANGDTNLRSAPTTASDSTNMKPETRLLLWGKNREGTWYCVAAFLPDGIQYGWVGAGANPTFELADVGGASLLDEGVVCDENVWQGNTPESPQEQPPG